MVPSYSQFAVLLTILWLASDARAYERPKLILNGSLEGATVASSANLSIGGRIEPTIEGPIEVKIFSLLENGSLHQLGGATAQVNHTGTFGVGIFPPKTGWPPGKIRVKVAFTLIPQVKAQTDFEIVTRKDSPPFSSGEDKQPLDIGRVIDLADSRGKTVKVPPHARFYIQGTIERPKKKFISENGVAGPTVFADLSQKSVVYASGITISLAEKDPKDVFSYQWEVVSPHKAGLYTVRLTPMIFETGEEMGKAFAREEPDLTLEVEGDVDLGR
jgi:hypothetical protein